MHSHTEALARVVGIADPAALNALRDLHAEVESLPLDHAAHARFVALIGRCAELARGNRNGRLFVEQVQQAAAELVPLVDAAAEPGVQ
jgi:hypothetical protein